MKTEVTSKLTRWVDLRGASVRFGAATALQGVHLTIHPGERLLLIGPNGSGKSTLLQVLQGGLRPDGGTRHAAPGLRVAMVYQRPFHLHLSVRANLRLALWLAGLPKVQRLARSDEALSRVGLLAVADRRATELSGGQQQRLALARVWALRPQLLLLDEPTANLDPSARRDVEALITEFAAEFGDAGFSVVMSSHHLAQARRLATRVAYLEAGQLVADRPADRFFEAADLPDAAHQFLLGETV